MSPPERHCDTAIRGRSNLMFNEGNFISLRSRRWDCFVPRNDVEMSARNNDYYKEIA